MNSKTKTLTLVAVTAAALGFGAVASADRGGQGCGCGGAMFGGGMHGGGNHGDALAAMGHGKYGAQGRRGGPGHLDLDEAQRAELKTLRESFQPRWQSLHQRLQENRQALRDLRHSDSADDAELDLLADRHGALIAESIKLRADMHDGMNAILGDQQRRQLRERRQHHQG